jgi:hypothetical protein
MHMQIWKCTCVAGDQHASGNMAHVAMCVTRFAEQFAMKSIDSSCFRTTVSVRQAAHVTGAGYSTALPSAGGVTVPHMHGL